MRNVRNFWIKLDVDGQKRMAGGPARKDGGFELTVKMRNGETGESGVVDALTIRGIAHDSGVLELTVAGPDGKLLAEYENHRRYAMA